MASKKRKSPAANREENPNAHIMGAGEIVEQKIVDTLEINYMPYAMSVIMSRAIPEIDGFKPSHRKLLYTMYKMGLLKGSRIKSANIVLVNIPKQFLADGGKFCLRITGCCP